MFVSERKDFSVIDATLPLTRPRHPAVFKQWLPGFLANFLRSTTFQVLPHSAVVHLVMDGRVTPPPVHHVLRPHHIDLIAMLLLIFKEFELQKTLPKDFLLYMYRV